MSDLIRRSDALAACQGMDPEGDINNLPAVTVGVRKLVWQEANDGNHKKGECFSTRSPVSFAPIAAHKKHDGWWLNVDCKTYPTLDAAKAAAQADYEARILAALEPATAPFDAAEFAAMQNKKSDAELMLDALTEASARELTDRVAAHHYRAAICEALEGMLSHSCVADAGADMKDAQDHEAERKARAILALIQKGAADDRA